MYFSQKFGCEISCAPQHLKITVSSEASGSWPLSQLARKELWEPENILAQATKRAFESLRDFSLCTFHEAMRQHKEVSFPACEGAF